MNAVDTSDALDFTKENIKPLKQGRKPVQLETALQAQSNMEVQQKLNKEKEQFEHSIRTYEGDDPLAPRFEYIKWLEQIHINQGRESNLLPLIEETVQKFKDNDKYKQDQRFVQILINFIENQSNALELYQTVYNQGLGTMCALFYRAWADLLERCNDFKRVDQIFLLGIKSKAEPISELEQAHLQFQLSIARRMLNGQLSNDDEDKNAELGKRQAFNVLKKSETHSGMRHGLGGLVGKGSMVNNNNGKMTTLRVFEDNDENGIFPSDSHNKNDLAPKGLNKENTVNPGPWTKPKKSRVNVPVPVSTINFEVHEDNNKECITKLTGITVPNALRSIKGSSTVSCPVAIFEPPDPTKRPMYCKDKVYAAGRDVQLEEIRYEIYLKQQKDKHSVNSKHPYSDVKAIDNDENTAKGLEKIILPEDSLKTDDFKIPLPQQMESDPLSQSVTVNTRAAIDLVQQMWNSPKADNKNEEPELYRKEVHVQVYVDENNENQMKIPEVYTDEIDDNEVKSSKIPTVYIDEPETIEEKAFKIPKLHTTGRIPIQRQPNKIKNFEVYEDNNTIEMYQDKNEIKVYQDENKIEVYQDENDVNVYQDENNVPVKNIEKQDIDSKSNVQVYSCEDSAHPITENKSPFKQFKNIEENDDDLTCSTKAFAFLLTSSTPLAPTGSKSKSVFQKKESTPLNLYEEKEVKEAEEFQAGKSLSMILEASKERNSSTLSGIMSSNYSVTKLDQQSTIDFGDSINPFDEELIATLLKKAIKFPKKHHLPGFLQHKLDDLPTIRSEFKLGNNKMTFLSELGKGSYARVIKARVDDKNGTEMALKIQKPACAWEWYISKEIQQRLKDSEKLSYFVNMENMHVFKNGSIISMEFATHGTLLSVVLAYKSALNRSIPVTIAALLVSQITSAVKYLHQCQIIHGDLKPDNVIIKSLPNMDSQPCVQLIDFGRSIDMTLFPPNTSFTYSVKTADFICHEMREKLPWTYQTDYYGLAGIIYMILMSDYMKTQKIRKVWVLLKPFPRYIDKHLWDGILNKLLNIESCEKLPNLDDIIDQLTKYLSIQQKIVLSHNLAGLKNVLNKR